MELEQYILRALNARGSATRSKIKSYLSLTYNLDVSLQKISSILNQLEKSGLVCKKYDYYIGSEKSFNDSVRVAGHISSFNRYVKQSPVYNKTTAYKRISYHLSTQGLQVLRQGFNH